MDYPTPTRPAPTKFVEQGVNASVTPPVGEFITQGTDGAENPFNRPIPAPRPPVQQAVDTNPISAHDQLWLDTKSLILNARRLNIDFEVLLRGALQEVQKGL